MTYIENVFVCMAAPLVVALLSLKRGHRAALVFCLAGMGACLLSAYLNTFFARLYQADAVNAATQIAPVVEEIMKLLPLLFFLAVFEPAFARFRLAAVIVAASFATFENICFLTQNGADQILFLLIRGFGTGAMHVVCGNVYGGALRPVWDSRPPAGGLPVRAFVRGHHLPRHLQPSGQCRGDASAHRLLCPAAHGAVLPAAGAEGRGVNTVSSDRPVGRSDSACRKSLFAPLSKFSELL